MGKIILATLNARYLHPSLGLRYLLANMKELRQQTEIMEFTLESRPADIAEALLSKQPSVIGLGVYIWNAEQTRRLVALLKAVSPRTQVVLGGPEVSHEWQEQPLVQQADYLITGQADLEFASHCRQLIAGEPPREKILHAMPPRLDELELPYQFYDDQDIAHRLVYVEASRGCPFKCEFCLSALDKTAWSFAMPVFLEAMKGLLRRGVRHFKFVDRTFNLGVQQSIEILDFFLAHWVEGLFLHFEVIPDRLPEGLKQRLRKFPPGALQLEIGIQTMDPEVQTRIDRKQDNERSRENLRWLRRETKAHLHADLIIGLPGEGVEGFARGFDALVALDPQEIQLGILKRLKGAPIARHNREYRMCYNPNPPFEILSNRDIDFQTMQRLSRFSRYWEMIANGGRFVNTLPMILGEQPFRRFMALSDWLFKATGQVHRIALKRLFELVYLGMGEVLFAAEVERRSLLARDWSECGARGMPEFLQPFDSRKVSNRTAGRDVRSSRQARHRRN